MLMLNGGLYTETDTWVFCKSDFRRWAGDRHSVTTGRRLATSGRLPIVSSGLRLGRTGVFWEGKEIKKRQTKKH